MMLVTLLSLYLWGGGEDVLSLKGREKVCSSLVLFNLNVCKPPYSR